MRGYKAIAGWARRIGPKARARFSSRRDDQGRLLVPSDYVIREALVRTDPVEVHRALQRSNKFCAEADESLALDEQGHPTHLMGAIGRQSRAALSSPIPTVSPMSFAATGVWRTRCLGSSMCVVNIPHTGVRPAGQDIMSNRYNNWRIHPSTAVS